MDSALAIENYFAPLQSKEGQDLLNKFKKFNYKFDENLSNDKFFNDVYECSSEEFNDSFSYLKHSTPIFIDFVDEMSSVLEQATALSTSSKPTASGTIYDDPQMIAHMKQFKIRAQEEKKAEAAAAAEAKKQQAADSKELQGAMDSEGYKAGETGILATLKNLWDTLTEGGSAWGIVHLILDVVGLLGDIGTFVGIPIGVAADLLNAVLYFYRGKGLLGVISLIAAAIPFGGDILKGFKPILKSFTKPFAKLMTKGAGKGITKEAAEILVKGDARMFKGGSRFFNYLKKVTGTAVGKVSKVIAYILDNIIGKVVEYIPGLGPYLKRFFSGMASKVKILSENLLTFSKGIDTQIEKALIKESDETFKVLNSSLKSKGGKISVKGKNIIVKDGGGKIIKEIPIEQFNKYANVAKKYPHGPLAKHLKNSDNVANFYKGLYNSGKVSERTLKALARGSNSSWWRKIFGPITFKAFSAFIAKQLVKLYSNQWNNAVSKFEKDATEDITTTSELHDIIKKDMEWEMEEKGSDYAVPYRDLFTDEPADVAIHLQKHQNYLAKKMGYPSVQTYFWSRAKAEKDKEMEKLYSKHAMSQEEYDKVLGIDNSQGSKQFESFKLDNQFSLKYIKSFDKF